MRYNPTLDGLRTFAVFLVMGVHCGVPQMRNGVIGVDIFFVLSGFLITSLLRWEIISTGKVNAVRFYRNRALRLYPPLLLMLAGYMTLLPAFVAADGIRGPLLASLYLSDYSMAFQHNLPLPISPTWSLSVEEHYYMLWPVVVMATARIPQRKLVWVFLGLFVLATVWRWADSLIWQDWAWTYFRFDTRLSGLLLGSTLAVLPWKPGRGMAMLLGVSGLATLCGVAFSTDPSPIIVGATDPSAVSNLRLPGLGVDLASGALLLGLLHSPPLSALFGAKPLAYLGMISYSIYLWHFPIAWALPGYLTPGLRFGLTAVITVTVAALSYDLVERPLKALRHRQSHSAQLA